jgi:hypothetical protein
MREAGAGLESGNVDADPPQDRGRQHEAGRTRRGSALEREASSTGSVHRGNQHGMSERESGPVGEARDGGESRTPNRIGKDAGHLGVGEGQRYRGSRVMPVEGRTLASGVFGKKGRRGD